MQDRQHEPHAIARRHFSFPHEVVEDPSLVASEKRALLCEWASDACAIEGFPALRLLPGTTFPVTFSAVMDALAQLDRAAERSKERAWAERGTLVDFSRRRQMSGLER